MNLNEELTNKGWIQTDGSCNQYFKKIDENKFLFREDRLMDPQTNETYVYESEIDLSKYSQEEMFKYVSCFDFSFNEMCTWIDEGKNLNLIAECIFEMN